MATGSVQLQGGQVWKEFNVTISKDAFLEARANLYAYLNSTMLMGGGTYTYIQASIMHFQRAYKYSNAMHDNYTDAYIFVWAVSLSSLMLPPLPFSSSTYDKTIKISFDRFCIRIFPLTALCCIISPHIGPRSEILVSVPTTAANDHTSFSPESLQVMVEELLLLSPVQLRVSRAGACG